MTASKAGLIVAGALTFFIAMFLSEEALVKLIFIVVAAIIIYLVWQWYIKP